MTTNIYLGMCHSWDTIRCFSQSSIIDLLIKIAFSSPKSPVSCFYPLGQFPPSGYRAQPPRDLESPCCSDTTARRCARQYGAIIQQVVSLWYNTETTCVLGIPSKVHNGVSPLTAATGPVPGSLGSYPGGHGKQITIRSIIRQRKYHPGSIRRCTKANATSAIRPNWLVACFGKFISHVAA